MTGGLTPDHALDYLRELCPAVSAAAVLADDRRTLAGDPSLAGEAPALLDGLEDGDARALARGDGLLLGARQGRCAIVARATGDVLVALALEDIRSTAAAVREPC